MHVLTREIPGGGSCPQCNAVLDAVTAAAEDVLDTIPTIGDITICGHCGTLLEFAEVGYRIADASRLAELPPYLKAAVESAFNIQVVVGDTPR